MKRIPTSLSILSILLVAAVAAWATEHTLWGEVKALWVDTSESQAITPVAKPVLFATVQFGRDNVGSPFPPVPGHDQSGHAKDAMQPRTVVVSVGGTVTFNQVGVHQVAIYQPDIRPEDIDVTVLSPAGAGCPPVPLINDPTGRVAVLGAQPCAGGATSPSFTFDSPGRYLIICTFLPHFVDMDMYGWVIVK